MLNAAAKAFLNAVGASCGPLYATALMRAGAAVKGKAVLDDADVVALVQAMATGIRDRGKAEPGQKTMLDAWAPAAQAAAEAQAAGQDLAGCLDAAAAAARAGAEATRGMVATKGRAERLGERAVGHVDPGAASAVVVIEAMRRLGLKRMRVRTAKSSDTGVPNAGSRAGDLRLDLVDRLDVARRAALLVEGLGEEGVGDRLGELRADDAGAHGDDLGVVGERGALGGVGVVGQRGADAGHLVGRDADADAGAADQDRLVVGAVLDLARHAVGQVGVELLGVVLRGC